MNFLEKIYDKARQSDAHIILPQSLDVRIQMAANDLSRGCSVDDVINVIAITSFQTFSYS